MTDAISIKELAERAHRLGGKSRRVVTSAASGHAAGARLQLGIG
jgi:hypothetical protein